MSDSPTPDNDDFRITRSSGDRWASESPQLAAKAVAMWAQGDTLRVIAAECSAAVNTIRAYFIRSGLYDAKKEEIAITARRGALQLSRRLAEESDDVPLAQLAMSAKLALDTALLAEGTPTHIVQHNHKIEVSPITRDRVREFRAQLQKGKVIDVEAETAAKK